MTASGTDGWAPVSRRTGSLPLHHERVHITKNGKDYVVLLAAEDLESIEATLELLADPAAQERIAQSRDEIARGEGLSIAEVARSLEARFGKRRP